MVDQLRTWVTSLGYAFEIDLKEQPNKWHKVFSESGFKGSYIFSEVKFGDALSLTATIYDFKKGEAFTERFDSRPLSDKEVERMSKERELQEKKLLLEKQKLWAECRDYCKQEWDLHAHTVDHPYLNKKGVEVPSGIFKSRKSEVSGEPELLCPLSDADGVMWGYQLIEASGKKRFNIGQRTDGIFVALGMVSKPARIYLTEGVATGLTVFQAIGGAHPVVCCLSAANLLHVSKHLRKAFPKAPFVICADDDNYGTSNPGRRYADLSAQEVDGIAVTFPDFGGAHSEARPTDFNDLHQLEGLGAVKSQIDATKLTRPEHFWALGYEGSTYYFTTLQAPIVHTVREFSPTEMLKLMSLKKWHRLFPEHLSKQGKLDWEPIRSELISMAQKKGLFKLTDTRGLGLYLEENKPCLHLGDRVYFEGQEHDLQDFESQNFYDLKARKELPERVSGPKQKEYTTKLLNILKGYTWENQLAPELLLGWIYCAVASGALNWRPHLLVSAKAGSGKTTITSLIVSPLLAYSHPVEFENATEAGVRQALKNDAVPFVHDEFDTNQGDERRMKNILNLCRAASSARGGRVARGTPGGKHLHFDAKFCAYLTGINVPDLNEADQSRITHLRIKGQSARPWREVELEILKTMTDEFVRGFFWNVFDTVGAFSESARVLQGALNKHGERAGQQYGSLLAGFYHLFHMEQITTAKAEEFATMLENAARQSDSSLTHDDNAVSCMDWLTQLVVRVETDRGVRELTLARILSEDGDKQVYEKDLAAVGIRITPKGEVFVASQSKPLLRHFENTQWPNYAEALSRLSDAKRTQIKVDKHNRRGVLLRV